jgi:hypothetical protein
MQYVLQCVAVLNGAGEPDGSEYGDDNGTSWVIIEFKLDNGIAIVEQPLS